MSNFKRYTSYLGIKGQWERWLKTKCSTLVSQFRHVTRLGIFSRHNQGITEVAGAGQLQSFEPPGSAVAQSHRAVPTHVGCCTARHAKELLHFRLACHCLRITLINSQDSYNLNCTGFLLSLLHITSTWIHHTF